MENNKDFMLLHGKQVRDYVAWRQERERRSKFAKAQAQKVFVVPAPGYFNAWNNEIASWLTTNLRQKRKHRQKQLWIQGPGGIGKTTLVTMMEEIYSLSIYRWPKDERWWDLYGDGQYDLIVLDEFRSQKMITELNPILSGDPTTLSTWMSPITKRDILPVIIMSNYTPEECFPSANEHGKLEPLLDRITVVKCEGPIRIVEGAPPAECSTPFQFDDLPPPPPGSQFVLTDDYEDVFLKRRPNTRSSTTISSLQGCAMRDLNSQLICIFFLKIARPMLAITETQTTAWKTKCQLKKRRRFEDPLRQCLIPPLILIVITILITLTRSLVKVAQQCLLPETFNKDISLKNKFFFLVTLKPISGTNGTG